MEARRVRYARTPAHLRDFYIAVWRNLAFFLLTVYGISYLTPSYASPGASLSAFFYWSLGLTFVAALLLDVAAIGLGVAVVRRLQRQPQFMELLALTTVTTERLFDVCAAAGWLRVWRGVVILTVARIVLVGLLVLQLLITTGDEAQFWDAFFISLPAVWLVIWLPARRAHLIVEIGAKNALIHRGNVRLVVGIVGDVVTTLTVISFFLGMTLFFVVLYVSLVNSLEVSFLVVIGGWAFPVMFDRVFRFLRRAFRQDVLIRSRWYRVE